MGVTIKDVAKKAGMSVTAVSLVLNNKETRISKEKRALIESAAQELNYRPNRAAASLVTKKSKQIALILPESSYYCFADLIRSMEYACRNVDYHLIVSFISDDEEQIEKQISSLISTGVEGIVMEPSVLSASIRDLDSFIEKAEIPVIPLAAIGNKLLQRSIAPLFKEGSYLAVKTFLQNGRKRIGYIGSSEDSCVNNELLAGYTEAIESEELEFEESLVFEGEFTSACGSQGLTKLFDQHVDAVFTSSMAIAQGVLAKAAQLGISVPGELGIVTFGSSSVLTDYFPQEISYVSVHFDRIARKAISSIRNAGDEKATPAPDLVMPTVIDKGTF